MPLLSVFAIGTIIITFVYLSNTSQQIMQENAITGAQRYLEALTEFRTIYTSEVIKTAKQKGLIISHNYQEIEGAIPLPATLSMALGEKIGNHQSAIFIAATLSHGVEAKTSNCLNSLLPGRLGSS